MPGFYWIRPVTESAAARRERAAKAQAKRDASFAAIRAAADRRVGRA